MSSAAGNGQLVLYPVGQNGKDNGGMTGDTLFDEQAGDRVSQYPSR